MGVIPLVLKLFWFVVVCPLAVYGLCNLVATKFDFY